MKKKEKYLKELSIFNKEIGLLKQETKNSKKRKKENIYNLEEFLKIGSKEINFQTQNISLEEVNSLLPILNNNDKNIVYSSIAVGNGLYSIFSGSKHTFDYIKKLREMIPRREIKFE